MTVFRRTPASAILPLMLILSGCVSGGQSGGMPAERASSPTKAMATLYDAAGKVSGKALFRQQGADVRVDLAVKGLTPGLHGAHVHMAGRCDGPDFKTAGGHWNPAGHQHGLNNPQGAHMGDMPNISVGENGSGRLQYIIRGASLAGGLLDGDGAAMLVHAGPDDMVSDPAGNSGGRVLCGVIVRN